MKTYRKKNDWEIEIIEAQPDKITVRSYDYIVNRIQELQNELAELEKLKKEADKFNLQR